MPETRIWKERLTQFAGQALAKVFPNYATQRPQVNKPIETKYGKKKTLVLINAINPTTDDDSPPQKNTKTLCSTRHSVHIIPKKALNSKTIPMETK